MIGSVSEYFCCCLFFCNTYLIFFIFGSKREGLLAKGFGMNRYRKKISTRIFDYVNVLNNEYHLFLVIKGNCSLNMCFFPCHTIIFSLLEQNVNIVFLQ